MKQKHNHNILQERIIAHFYMDEILTNEETEAIKSCNDCTEYFAQIKLLETTSIENNPDEHYWDNYFTRLEKRLDDSEKSKIVHLYSKFKSQYIVAAAIVILFIGFSAGKFLYQPVNTDKLITNIDAMEIQNLVSRSKVLFTQFNQLDEFNARFYLEKQINQSKNLLRFTSYLRKKHEDNIVLGQFLGELEKLFITMKSIEEEDIYTIHSIQQGVNSQRIIAKLDNINTEEIE